MNYLSYQENLNNLYEQILKGRVLSPKQAATSMNCSERTIRRMINNLREQGHEIEYCRTEKKYFEKIN